MPDIEPRAKSKRPERRFARSGLRHLLALAEQSEQRYEQYSEKAFYVKLVTVLVVMLGTTGISLLLSTVEWNYILKNALSSICLGSGIAILMLLSNWYLHLVRKMQGEQAAMWAAADLLRDLIPTVEKGANSLELLAELRIRLSRLSIGPGKDHFQRLLNSHKEQVASS